MTVFLIGIRMLALLVAPVLSAQVPLVPTTGDSDRWVVQDQRDAIEIFAEFPLDLPLVRRHLQDVRNELDTLLAIQPSGEPIQIIVFQTRQRFLNYLVPRIPEARDRRAIFFMNEGTCQIYAVRHDLLMTDLRHEFTHAILHQQLQFLPLWMDEGLAEVLEEPSSARPRSPRLTSVRWKSRFGWKPSLRSLEAIPTAAAMTADDYRDSWAWTEFLLNDSPQTRQVFTEYLATISKGEAPGPFSQYLAARDATAENRIKFYFQKIRLSLNSAQD